MTEKVQNKLPTFVMDLSCMPNIATTDGLKLRKTVAGWGNATLKSTQPLPARHYWEVKIEAGDNKGVMLGVCNKNAKIKDNFVGGDANGWSFYAGDGSRYFESRRVEFTTVATVSDVYGLLLDTQNHGSLTLYKNGLKVGVLFTGLELPLYAAVSMHYVGETVTIFPDAVPKN